MMKLLIFFLLVLVSIVVFCSSVFGKECTNIPTQIASHTIRYQVLSSKNETWKEEMLSHYHLNHAEESTWMDLLPRKILIEEFDWAMLYRNIKYSNGYNAPGGNFLKEVSLHDVRLDPDFINGRAQQTNLEYLLILDVDSLVWSFRKQAGLPNPGTPYGGWEAPDVELRGHFVGHYLSAAAKMWASTHNDTLQDKMTTVLNALYECQKKIGTGYLSAFPSELFDRFEDIKSVWAPYYTIHKIMAGLVDQYLLARSDQALKMVIWMAEYFGNRIRDVIARYSIERHWQSLNEETGGMNDVFYDLYSITGDQKHLVLAHLFDKPCFLGLLALQVDSLAGFHANTHIPVVVGAQRRYEITGDPLYKEIGLYFMDIVNSSHSYASGGTSVSEFWSNPKRLAETLKVENQESCTTYNMLKVSRNLFRWTRDLAYADYYERALTNSVLSIQRGTEPGIMIYMLPQGRGVSKARSYHRWGSPFNSFWCCYGTGIESFSKLGDSIYFEENGDTPGLFIIQFISSSLNWISGGIVVNQKVDPIVSSDAYLRVTLTFASAESNIQSSTLNIRIPFWVSSDGATASLNGQKLELPVPGNYLSVSRKWMSDDKIQLHFPIEMRTEQIQDDRAEYASVQGILFGPYLLVGLSSGDWEINSSKSFTDWITAVPTEFNSQLVSLAQDSTNGTLVFTNSNNSLIMGVLPEPGTDAAIYSTFRLIYTKSLNQRHTLSRFASDRSITGQQAILEPFDLPGAAVVHQGPNKNLAISMTSGGETSLFNVITGVNGKPYTVALESVSQPGCFVSSDLSSAGKSLQLVCGGDATTFQEAVSFSISKGAREYNPISFMARGTTRNFVLEPLMSLRDESYTAYFNITS